jgi:heat shock protein HtpX
MLFSSVAIVRGGDFPKIDLVDMQHNVVEGLKNRLESLAGERANINPQKLAEFEKNYEVVKSKIGYLEHLFDEPNSASFLNPNQIKTALLLLTVTGLTAGITHLGISRIQNQPLRYVSYGLAGLIILFELVVWYFSETVALVFADAEKMDRKDNPKIYEIVEELARKAKIPTPKIWYNSMAIPNAFACGRGKSSSSILVTKGLLELLDENELRAVLAHEVSHIKNYDTTLSTLAGVISVPGLIFSDALQNRVYSGSRNERDVMLGYFIGLFGEWAFKLLNLSVSRSREYLADQSGAILIADPASLASALSKIKDKMKSKYNTTSVFSSEELSFSKAFEAMCITSPFKEMGISQDEKEDEVNVVRGWIEWFGEMFSTHPLTKNRVNKLKELEQKYVNLLKEGGDAV